MCEITAPSTEARDWGLKRELYVRFGVEEYWVLTQDGALTVHRLQDGELKPVAHRSSADVFRSEALDGKLIELDKIYRHVR